MSVEKINESALAAEGFFHTTQKDVPGKTAQEMKEFFDRLPREVLIPKINAIIEQAEADKKETAENLENKADGDSVYTKTEADALLENKADGDSVYTKAEADTLLENKADGDSVYTKTEADKLLKKKIDANKAALEFANALKGTASGVSVSVDDASPLEHDLNVKLESKNLFTTDYYKTQYGTSNRKLEGNNFEFTSEMDAKGQSHVDFDIYLEAGTYYLSGNDISTSNSAFKGGYAIMKGNDFIVNRATSTTIDSIINITESGTYTINFYGDYAADIGTVYTYSNIQLERGSSKTNFTHFTHVEGITVSKLIIDFEVQSADASADGTVEGLVSSPSFELTSNAMDGSVLIYLEYNRDINRISFGNSTGTGDGFSPIAKVEETESGAVITITDKNGTTTATVKNGKDGDTYTLIEADKTEIAELVNVVPEGVKTAVSTVVDKALSRDDNNVLRFIISSDSHQKNDDELITKGNKELGQAHGEVLKLIGVDFVANLGDMAWASYKNTTEEVIEQLKTFNDLIGSAIKGEDLLYTEGNHDDANYSMIDNDGDGTTSSTYKLSPSAIHALIWSKNKGVVCDTEHWIDGYCYKDFEHLKTRVICLNTEQGTGDGGAVNDYQLKWFAETALDMTDKTDWNIITMAHHPLDYGMPTLFKDCVNIVNAFINGDNFSYTTTNGTAIAIDYSNKNCQYVGHFHGHAHAYSVVKMQKYVNGEYVDINAYEICIPNACYTRNNQYLGNENERIARYSTETTYNKADVDGQRTSFNLVAVCLDKKMIYVDNYGAGIDRVVSYDIVAVSYTITRNLTNCTSSGNILSVVENESHTETIIANSGYTMNGATVTVTMGGKDISSSYTDGVLNIASVTGNIVITASAVVETPAISYINQIPISTDADGTVYNGIGYKENMYLSSGVPTSRSGIYCSGFIPIGCGSSNMASGEQIVRMSGITAKQNTEFRFALYTVDKEFVAQLYGSKVPNSEWGDIQIPYELDGDGNITMFDLTAITAHLRDVGGMGTTAFMRICSPNIDGNSILAVNQPIE